MSGLFDFLSSEDPNTQAQLAMAAGLLGGRGSFNQIASQALMGGTQAGQRASAIKRQADLDNLAKQRFQLALDEEQRKKKQFDALEQFRASIPSPEMTSAQMALAGGGGPTQANAAMMPPISQNDRLQFGAMKAGAMSPLDYLNLQRKDTTPIKGSPGDVFFQPGTFKKLAEVAPKPEGTPSALQEYQFAKANGEPGTETFTGWMQAQKRAGASNVSVNTGEKGFKNELALKQDFRSEPIYKDYQDMQSAYKQIKAGVAAANPVGDLAAATKMMKLLDPSSVVRESELGMAMAATGKMDRLQNYIDMQIKGTKLTPQQRSEFSSLADDLYEAAGQAYNQKRSEYEGIGERYKLDTTGLGNPHKSIKNKTGAVRRYNPDTGKIE
jgi:hypothetical protein